MEFARMNMPGKLLTVMPADVDVKEEEKMFKDDETKAKKRALAEKAEKFKEKKRLRELEEKGSEVAPSEVVSEGVSESWDGQDEEEEEVEVAEEYETDDDSYADDVYNCDICSRKIEPGNTIERRYEKE
jgi:hypothetical protein